MQPKSTGLCGKEHDLEIKLDRWDVYGGFPALFASWQLNGFPWFESPGYNPSSIVVGEKAEPVTGLWTYLSVRISVNKVQHCSPWGEKKKPKLFILLRQRLTDIAVLRYGTVSCTFNLTEEGELETERDSGSHQEVCVLMRGQEGVSVLTRGKKKHKKKQSPSAVTCTKYGKFLPGILFRLLSPCSLMSCTGVNLKAPLHIFKRFSPFAICCFIMLRIWFYFCPSAYTCVCLLHRISLCGSLPVSSLPSYSSEKQQSCHVWWYGFAVLLTTDGGMWQLGWDVTKVSWYVPCSWDITVAWVTPKGSSMACSKQQKIWQKICWTSYKEIYL